MEVLKLYFIQFYIIYNIFKLITLNNNFLGFTRRLTGAGWGGCIVALVTKDNLRNYIEGIKSDYYATLNSIHAREERLDAVIFPTQPGPGAQIFEI